MSSLNRSLLWLIKRMAFHSSMAVIVRLLFPLKAHSLTEQELQVALLLKVAQFTHWPESDQLDFKFCLYRGKGYEVFKDPRHKQTKVGPLQVRFVFLKQDSSTYDIHQCQILFITEGSAVETKQVLRRASYAPTLTVSSLEGFAGLGGMIELVKIKNRFNFRINLTPVKKSKLGISSSLLEISTVIREGQ